MCKVMDNMGLVHYVLQKKLNVYRNHESYEDYVQVGTIGLIKAVQRFDESKDVEFSSYAVLLIRGEIIKHRRDLENTMHINRDLKTLMFKILRHTEDFSLLDDEAHLKNLAKKLDVDFDTVIKAVKQHQVTHSIKSLDYMVTSSDNKAMSVSDLTPDNTDIEDQTEVKLMVEKALSELKPIEAQVLKMYYLEDKVQTEIAKELKITQVQVSRTLSKALCNAQRILVGDVNHVPITVDKGRAGRKSKELITYKDLSLTCREWAMKLNIPYTTIYWRYKQGFAIEKVLGFA